MVRIYQMVVADLAAVGQIQRRAYSAELVEPLEVLASRLSLAPEFSYVARGEGGEASLVSYMGYLLAHPWPGDESPGLSREILELPPKSDAIHLHDMAVDPSFGGRGVGRALLARLLERAEGANYSQVTLVAVQEARGYWEKMGFEAVRAVDGYDSVAMLMKLRFDR